MGAAIIARGAHTAARRPLQTLGSAQRSPLPHIPASSEGKRPSSCPNRSPASRKPARSRKNHLAPERNQRTLGKINSRATNTNTDSGKSSVPADLSESPGSRAPSWRSDDRAGGRASSFAAKSSALSKEPARWRPNQVPPLGIRCPRRGTAGFIDPTARQATLPAPQSTSPASSDRNSLVTRSIDPPCKLYRLAKEEGRLANRQIAGPSARSGGNRRWRSDTSRKTAQRTSFLNLIRCGWSAEVPFRLW